MAIFQDDHAIREEKKSIDGITWSFSLFRILHCPFSQTVVLWELWAAGCMLEVPLCSKMLELLVGVLSGTVFDEKMRPSRKS